MNVVLSEAETPGVSDREDEKTNLPSFGDSPGPTPPPTPPPDAAASPTAEEEKAKVKVSKTHILLIM